MWKLPARRLDCGSCEMRRCFKRKRPAGQCEPPKPGCLELALSLSLSPKTGCLTPLKTAHYRSLGTQHQVVRPVASMSSPRKTRQFLIDKCRTKYSLASGATRGTPSARDRHRDGLEIAFSEINGLMAGMHYQDQVSEEYPHPLEISDDDLHDREDVGDQPMASQWAAIRSLTKETEYQYNRFLILASRSDDPIISDLLALYPNPKSIRTTGAQLFKDVLEGFRPQKLSHVFAFTFFSYAISKLLCKMDRFDRDDILRDLKT
ncbi:hypothetical protein B0T18DRAFT_60058 [Schizothecium vesticola]|uniref:Uncharacterized protein n=1 Tax=Schizothecium vesticola TaxID=314040 RepID=A0AA40K9M8_9PEZI|nr:hypothetical protein B0T18DRAFT_60058 [Schizothecium vesticola]